MLSDLQGVTIQQAIEALENWKHLHPGDAEPMLATAAEIATWAKSRNTKLLPALTDSAAENLLLTLSGADNLDAEVQERQGPVRDESAIARLHLVRNTLVALRAVALLAVAAPDWLRGHRPTDDTVDAGIPAIASLSARTRRPARDDEIWLARLGICLALHENAEVTTLNGYALCESGLRVSYATGTCLGHVDHLNDPEKDTTVRRVSGPGRMAGRLTLSTFSSQVLLRTMAGTRDARRRLTYNGSDDYAGGGIAHRSLGKALTKLLRRCGWVAGELTLTSLTMWKVDHHLRRHQDFTSAMEVYGARESWDLLRVLGYAEDRSMVDLGTVDLLDGGERVAIIPAHQIEGAKAAHSTAKHSKHAGTAATEEGS